MPPKVALILALVIAAAVLVPLRRARKAFPVYSEAAGIVAAPRISMRRRPAGRRAPVRIPGTLERRSLPESPAVAGVGVVEAVPVSVNERTADRLECNSTSGRSVSVAPRPGATNPDEDGGGDEAADRIEYVIRAGPPDTPGPDPSAPVPVRPARDVPVPPPKHA